MSPGNINIPLFLADARELAGPDEQEEVQLFEVEKNSVERLCQFMEKPEIAVSAEHTTA